MSRHLSQWKCWYMDLEALPIMVPMVSPYMVMLSMVIGDGGEFGLDVPSLWWSLCPVHLWMLTSSSGLLHCWSLCHYKQNGKSGWWPSFSSLLWTGRKHPYGLPGSCHTHGTLVLHLDVWGLNQGVGNMPRLPPACTTSVVLQSCQQWQETWSQSPFHNTGGYRWCPDLFHVGGGQWGRCVSSTCCTLASYWMGAAWYSASCGIGGIGCWYNWVLL